MKRNLLLVAALCVASLLTAAGCSERKNDKAGSQTAARVDQQDITVHQINQVLIQQQPQQAPQPPQPPQRVLQPGQTEAASQQALQILERLIDQALAVQKARDMKIDQDPRVMLQVEAAKRELLARAYLDRLGEAAAKPSAEDIKKFYDGKPELFKERRVYNLQELAIEATPDQVSALRGQIQRVASAAEFVSHLKANNLRFSGSQAVRAAEQLPAEMLGNLARMKDSQMVLLPAPTGAVVIMLVGSRAEPVDEARARPAIEQALLNEARRKLIDADAKALRASAKIEYVGKFAEGPKP